MFFSTHIFVVDMLELKCYCQINEAFHVYKCNVKNVLEWVRVVKILKKTVKGLMDNFPRSS